jgi:hypothetical protein
MEKNHTTAFEALKRFAELNGQSSKIEIAGLLFDYNLNRDDDALAERIIGHPEGEWAAIWVETYLKPMSLADEYGVACMVYDTAQEFGTPVEAEKALRDLNKVRAKMRNLKR